jgi:hypothetical protein
MKDFVALKNYCASLGLSLVRFDADNHAVYRAPGCQHIEFRDSNPHNQKVGFWYFSRAKNVAREIEEWRAAKQPPAADEVRPSHKSSSASLEQKKTE